MSINNAELSAAKVDVSRPLGAQEHNNAKLRMIEKIAYGSGDFANNLIFMTIMNFLLFFYTDVFGISAMVAGTLFLVTRVEDALDDFITGVFVDHTHSRWGKLRPYLLFGSIPLGITAILCFTTPALNASGKIVYAYVTYIALMLMYSMVGIPYSAMTAAMTQDRQERVSLSSIRMIFAVIGGLIASVLTPILTTVLGGGNPATGYQLTMVIFAAIAIAVYMFTFAKTKERVTAEKNQKLPLALILKIIFRNKYLMLMSLLFMLMLGAYTLKGGAAMYYFTYNMGKPDLVSIYFLVTTVFMLVGMFTVPVLSKKFGKRNALCLGLAVVVVSNVALYFVGYANTALIFVCSIFSSLGIALPMALAWGMIPDTVEYAEWKHGARAEGIIYSASSFAQKVAMAIGGSISGIILTVVRYAPNAVQTPVAQNGIGMMMALIPGLLMLAGFIVMLFYNMDDEKYNKIVEEIASRRN
jgi:sugar (glycoside-pentoside-hexuronide) transporter